MAFYEINKKFSQFLDCPALAKIGLELGTPGLLASARTGHPQTHRWLAIAFTVAVIVNIVAVVQGRYTSRVGLLAVFPLALLLFTGLYLFVLPYATKWGSGRRTD